MEELTRTANAQLATFVLSLVVLDAVERLGLFPAACAGHSLGEYTALVASGALSLRRRGPPGGGPGRGHARGRRGRARGPWPPCSASPTTTPRRPASGPRATSGWPTTTRRPGGHRRHRRGRGHGWRRSPRSSGARKVLPIPVSGAFHTRSWPAARPALRKALDDVAFHAPEVPVVANVDARVHTDPDEWPGLLSAQLCSPVRWRQTLETLAGLGATSLVELGPGGVLTGLARRAVPEVRALAVVACPTTSTS